MTVPTTPKASPDPADHEPGPTGLRADLITASVAVLLFATAAVVGVAVNTDGRLFLHWPPLYAWWDPHLGPGTPMALVVAGVTVLHGPSLAQRLSWGRLLGVSVAGSLAWMFSLAMIDGWQRGIAGRLEARHEYLAAVDRTEDVGHFLRTYTDHILLTSPDNWPVHVAGHPPAALLTFSGLDRIGLGGGAWAAMFVLVTAATAAAAVLVTVRTLAGEDLARRAAPFMVLVPAAVWMGVSADAWFAAVAAWAIALLALSATGRTRWPRAAALGSGLLFGLLLYLSYGLVLMGLLGLTVLLAARTWRPLPWLVLGVLAWVAVFTAAGFWWFDGYFLLVERYYQGAARLRPYEYFVWANLATQVVTAGTATVVGLRRAAVALPDTAREGVRSLWRERRPVSGRTALILLVSAAVLIMLLASLSGMGKAETERIWLPFVLWAVPATALLPRGWHRGWLAAQAAVALTVNHLLFTGW
ncbi:hypothetical protein PJ985_13635 [Streptomyces sp. ACA25]|uniref:hypothetical protein n=1 Tax=Streptomyces sp. ACA25 TaxID=3022596 RepID=UPI002307CD7C|nr:hypothetical protein [Streptomyces sp. ACA25]MDB1088609.1 hypothetical protein [Streptomyces sp. ACA25]